MPSNQLTPENLERHMLVAFDVKKEFTYDKGTGEWCWYDRGDEENLYGRSPTFWECLLDAVEPYTASESELDEVN